MCAVCVHIDSADVIAMYVAACMRTSVYHKTLMPILAGKVGKRRSEEPGPNYQIVKFLITHWFIVHSTCTMALLWSIRQPLGLSVPAAAMMMSRYYLFRL